MKDIIKYINENLQAHDYKKLQQALLKEYGNEILKFRATKKSGNKQGFYIYLRGNYEIAPLIAEEMLKQNKFKKILRFYNYFAAKILDKIFVEPRISKNANDFIYNKCNGICWHLTTKDNVESIKKNGLKLRGGGAHDFPERIYVFATDKNNNDIRNNAYEVTPFVQELGMMLQIKNDNLALFKIDLSETQKGIDFYEDVAMDSRNTFYTMTSIPAKFVHHVSFDKNKFINYNI